MHEQQQSDEQATADQSPEIPRNGAACSTECRTNESLTRRRSGIRDSKHTNAATLAIDLASSSSWSNIISPDSSHVRESYSDNTSLRLPDPNHDFTTGMSIDTVLEPPPGYSPRRERDMIEGTEGTEGSETVNMQQPRGRPEMSQPFNQGYGFRESEYVDGADAPLLGQSNHQTMGDRGRWTSSDSNASEKRGPSSKGRFLVAVLFLIFFICATFGILCFTKTHSKDQPILPLIQTNQSHIYRTTSDHISGRFELRERLELSTTTGNIDIQIDPQPSKDHNNTLTLILSSTTGSITLRVSEAWYFRQEKILPTIHTEIKTVTGTVRADVLLGCGGSATVSTITGVQEVRAFVYEASSGDAISSLTTTSHIGGQVIKLFNYGTHDATIDTLEARHESLGTASIDLQYSRHWRGRIHAKATPGGRVEVQGDAGLEFDQEGEFEVIAHKGKGKDLKTVYAESAGTGEILFKSWYTW